MNTVTNTEEIKPIEMNSFLEVGEVSNKSETVLPMELVNIITGAFKDAGHPKPEVWATFMQPGSWNHTDMVVQRHAINTALRLILAGFRAKSTLDVRFCIVDNCTLADWKRLIKSHVVKFFMENKILY